MTRITMFLGYGVLALMVVLVIAAILNMRQGGSLDDLPASIIKGAVDAAKES